MKHRHNRECGPQKPRHGRPTRRLDTAANWNIKPCQASASINGNGTSDMRCDHTRSGIAGGHVNSGAASGKTGGVPGLCWTVRHAEANRIG